MNTRDLDYLERELAQRNSEGISPATGLMLIAHVRGLEAAVVALTEKHQSLVRELEALDAAMERAVTDAYADGHAAGDRDRFARCAEDIARALVTPTMGWASLVENVRDINFGHAERVAADDERDQEVYALRRLLADLVDAGTDDDTRCVAWLRADRFLRGEK